MAIRHQKRLATRRVGAKKTSSSRDPEDGGYGFSDPREIERLLTEVSERVVKADAALTDALPTVRRSKERGSRQRVKSNIKYLERLLTEALRYVDRANQAIGF